jgi:hypothetical protein
LRIFYLPKALRPEDLTISTILPQNCYNLVPQKNEAPKQSEIGWKNPDQIVNFQVEVFGRFGGPAIFASSANGRIANTTVKVGH